MTISCTCPKCGQLCGFKDVYVGHRARCLQCRTSFIIPELDGEVGHPIPVEPTEPLPGFRLQLFIGWVVTFITAGYLLWYFIEIINSASDECDYLPDIYIGDGFILVKEIAKSIYSFIISFAIALIPAVIIINLLDAIHASWQWLNVTILILSLTIVPIALAVLACGVAPWMLFRFDHLFVIIKKTFMP